MLDSALDSASQINRDPATESQLVSILANQERAGLSDDDIRASWPDINFGTDTPGALELLSKSRAFRLVAWLRKQPNAPVPEVESHIPCRCEEVAASAEFAAVRRRPRRCGASALENAVRGVAWHYISITWLKETEGLRCDGDNLVVQVPSAFTVAWLEQRMYQTILRNPAGLLWWPSGTSVLRLPSPLSVRFTALPARVGDAGGQPMLQGRWVVVTVRVTG